MSQPIAAWRVTYTPGDWLVLSGPTSLVVMMPAPARMSALVSDLWSVVVRVGSIDELIQKLASFGLTAMPNMGVLFWNEAGLHSLLRGNVKLVDEDSGQTVSDGENVVTWTETPLGAERRLRMDLQAVPAEPGLNLPLMVGAVSASTVMVSTTEEARVRFPSDDAGGLLPRVESLRAGSAPVDGPGIAAAAVAGGSVLGGGESVVHAPSVSASAEAHRVDADEQVRDADDEPDVDDELDAGDVPDESPAPDETTDGTEDEGSQPSSVGEHEDAQPEQADDNSPLRHWEPGEKPGGGHADVSAEGEDGVDEHITEDAPPVDTYDSAEERAEAHIGVHEDPVMGEAEPYQPYTPEQLHHGGAQDELPPPQLVPQPRWGDDGSAARGASDHEPASDSIGRYASPDEQDEVSGDTILGGPGQSPFGPPPGTAVPPPVTAVPPPPASAMPGMPPGLAGVPSVAGPGSAPDVGSPAPARTWGPPPEPTDRQPSEPAQGPPRQPLGDHDGETVFATGLASTHKPQTANRADDSLVLAAVCAAGHPNPPGSRRCRLCPAPVDTANPRLVARPVIASVRTNAGEAIQLNRPVIVGRAPEMKGESDVSLLRVPSPSTDISRNHLRVSSHGWNIEITDLHSTNGTILHAPGEPPVRLSGGETVQAELGTVLDLGDGVKLRIEPPLA